MFWNKSVKNSPPFFFCLLFLVFHPPPATGQDDELALAEQVQELVTELRDQNMLFGAGYDPVKTDFAAMLDSEDVQDFFKNVELTSTNSGSIVKSVDALAVKVESLSQDISGLRVSDAGQGIEIIRNTQDIRDNRHFFGWFVVVMVSFVGYLHRWLHHNDKDTGGDDNG